MTIHEYFLKELVPNLKYLPELYEEYSLDNVIEIIDNLKIITFNLNSSNWTFHINTYRLEFDYLYRNSEHFRYFCKYIDSKVREQKIKEFLL